MRLFFQLLQLFSRQTRSVIRTAETSDAAFSMFPFLLCAIVVFGLFFALAVTQFGKKEMR